MEPAVQLNLFAQSGEDPEPEPAPAEEPPALMMRSRRKPKPRPPEKTPAEIAANAAAFHRWQRGECYAPAVWDVADQWVHKVRPETGR